MAFQVKAAPPNVDQSRIYLALVTMQQNLISTGDLIKVTKQQQVKI